MQPPITLEAFQKQFRAVEQSLRANLEQVRAELHQAGNKGSKAESAFRDTLARFISRRISLGHGEVIDSYGARSAQCDLVLATDQHPNWFTPNEASLFLVEAVAGAAEIKSVLTADHLTSAIEATRKFRQLRTNWGGRAEVVGAAEDVQRFYRNPPFFLFAYESQVSIETIAERVSAAALPNGGRHGESIDGVFVLDRGYVLNFGSGKGAFVAQGPTGERLAGYYYEEKDPLLALMMWLPLALAIPLSQLPVLSQYLLGDPSTGTPSDPDSTSAGSNPVRSLTLVEADKHNMDAASPQRL